MHPGPETPKTSRSKTTCMINCCVTSLATGGAVPRGSPLMGREDCCCAFRQPLMKRAELPDRICMCMLLHVEAEVRVNRTSSPERKMILWAPFFFPYAIFPIRFLLNKERKKVFFFFWIASQEATECARAPPPWSAIRRYVTVCPRHGRLASAGLIHRLMPADGAAIYVCHAHYACIRRPPRSR